MSPKSTLLALCLLSICALRASASPVAEWNPSQGTGNAGSIVVPDAVGSLKLEGGPDSDTSLARAADFPDGAAIVFGGSQTKSMRTAAGGKLSIGSGSTIEINVCPDASPGDMTILCVPGLELRYAAAKQQLSVIVFHDTEQNTANYTHVDLAAKPGQWSAVKVSISDTELACEVAGVSGRKKLLSPLKVEAAAVQLGMKGNSRPYKGKVGKITISQD